MFGMNLDELLSPLGGRLALLAMVLAVVGFGFLALLGSWLLDFARNRTAASLRPLRSLFALLLSIALPRLGGGRRFLVDLPQNLRCFHRSHARGSYRM